MSSRIVKQSNWPFREGESAQLIWIGTPFRKNNKQMLIAYFRTQGVTKSIEVDWGTLPVLAIQHYYVDGELIKGLSPEGTEIIDITIEPNAVRYSEKNWNIQGTTEKDLSQSFIVTFEGEKYTLPLIEVIRSILAPNRFLLYQLFEPNAFPQYFFYKYEHPRLHFDFTSIYEIKYTRQEYLLHLAWLISHSDIRQLFESIEPYYLNKGKIMFSWTFQQPITLKVLAKPNSYGGYTILRVLRVMNKYLPFEKITFSHPKLHNHIRSNEPKKYKFINKNKFDESDELELSGDFDGATSDFDSVEMEKQSHEYTSKPKITKVRKKIDKQRSCEDENTKIYYIDDQGKRSTADVGGSKIARGIEHTSLHEIKVHGELDEFIRTLRFLEREQNIQSVRAYVDGLPDVGGERKFKNLSDGITRRKYVLAEVQLENGKIVNVIEVEREYYSLSTLFIYSEGNSDHHSAIQKLLSNLIYDHGSWLSKSLNSTRDMGFQLSKLKHGVNEPEFRAGVIASHFEVNYSS